jgi:hypothetical protein
LVPRGGVPIHINDVVIGAAGLAGLSKEIDAEIANIAATRLSVGDGVISSPALFWRGLELGGPLPWPCFHSARLWFTRSADVCRRDAAGMMMARWAANRLSLSRITTPMDPFAT